MVTLRPQDPYVSGRCQHCTSHILLPALPPPWERRLMIDVFANQAMGSGAPGSQVKSEQRSRRVLAHSRL